MHLPRFQVTSLVALALFAAGCSNDESTTTTNDKTGYKYDGLCDINSGFKGDDLCLGKPPAEEGFQLHYGPTNYADPADTDRFVLQPGKEITDCLYMTTPNESEIFWSDYHMRARTGTHHIIVYAGDITAADGVLGNCSDATSMHFFVGAQSGIGPDGVRLDVPLDDKDVPPENVGYAQRLGPKQRIAFQMHYVNTGTTPLLREAWVNFHYEPKDQVKTVMDPIFFIGGLGMDVKPHSHEVVQALGCTLPKDGPQEFRVMGVTGHMHAHGKRLTAWKVDGAGNRTTIYETFSWEEPLNAMFDTVHRYPTSDAAARTDGAWSGLLTIKQGEKLEWECEFDNTLDTPLKFSNLAYTGEMCNVFGWYAPSIGNPWECYRL